MAGKNSRWLGPKRRANGQGAPRYPAQLQKSIREKYREAKGWFRGARVS